MIIEDNNFLTDYHKDQIENGILSGTFPFYWSEHQVTGDYLPALLHAVMGRTTKGHVIESDKINSPNFNFCKNVLDTFCNKNNIKYKCIYRASINLTFHIPREHGKIHEDHDFPHKQFLLYLNDSDGDTLLFNDKRKVYKRIKFEQYKGVVFDRCLHTQEYPTKSRRVVLVITFN